MLMLQLEEAPPCENHTDIPHGEMMALLVVVGHWWMWWWGVVVGCRRMTAGRWMVGAVVHLNEVMQTTVPGGASL